MKPLSLSCLLVLLLVSAKVFGLQGEAVADATSPWKLQVDLNDGSRVVGDPQSQVLPLDIEFDRLQIPLDRVRRAEWMNDRRLVRVELKNRDILTGTITTQQIDMSTLFGNVELMTSQMKALEVIPANRLGWLPSERDLVLYYSFDRDEGTKIVNHASDQLNGCATNVHWIDEGVRGGAVEFDGNASIEIPHHKDLCPAKLTLAAWIQPTRSSGGYEMVIAKTNNGSWTQGYGLVRRSGAQKHLTFFVNQYSNSGANVETSIGKWSHIAGVFDGENVSVYLNGELAGSAKVPVPNDAQRCQPGSNIQHTATPLYIGRDPSGYAWAGKMDELVIYSRVLDPAEIRHLYRDSCARQ